MTTRKIALAAGSLCLLAAASVQAGGDPARGEELAADCAACHGDSGLGDETFPAIAGMEEGALLASLKGFASGDSEGDFMPDVVAELSEQDMADVAAYYATLPASGD